MQVIRVICQSALRRYPLDFTKSRDDRGERAHATGCLAARFRFP